MTNLKLLSAALISAAMLGTPALASMGDVTWQHHDETANASAPPTTRYVDGRPVPPVGVESAPHYAKDCDVGDDEFIC